MPEEFEGDEYKALLQRARDQLPDKTSTHERFQVPDADSLHEGNTTVVRNFVDIAERINREPQHLLAFLLKELGTAGNQDGRRVIFKGRLSPRKISEKLETYVESYVLCQECKLPDTKLVKEGRIMILRCDACGAHRPVRIIKPHKIVEPPALEEGKDYDVVIESISRRGDGVAKVDKYIIYISGTTKGQKVKIHIEKISGNVAFGRVIQ